ncbi:hypothetical protein CPB86DRAFT_828315 [Serendipita vermifera]|nr:hypothetical protein CPB86DRAFT_828315 [Serendipita vermifera]
MRAKQVLPYLPKPAHFRLFYARITSSRLTLAFFLVTFLHFALQISFQSWAFSINAGASDFFSEILTVGGLPPHDNFAVLVPLSKDGKSGGEMRLCNTTAMEARDNIYDCPIVWKGRSTSANAGAVVGNDYAASPPENTSSSTSEVSTSTASDVKVVGTGQVTIARSSTTRRTVSTPAVLTPPTPTTQAAAPTRTVDDDSDDDSDDDDDDEEELDDRRLAKRTTHLVKLSPLSKLGRRDTTIVPVYNANNEATFSSNNANGQSATFATNAVGLPASMNTTTGEVGVVLSKQCVQMLVWPNQIIHNTKREDITFMGFQIWILGMSTVAILNESIPHILAALMTHALATAWSVYQLFNTASFQSEFARSTIRSGQCGGVNLLPTYWTERRGAEIAVLTVNCVSLVATGVMSWRLIKTFGWQTFKRIGASLEINRIYKTVLTFSVALQLTFFFIIATLGLWIDVMFNTILGRYADHCDLYKAFSIIVCVMMVPWLFHGWFAVRKEQNHLMSLFIASCVLLLSGWATLFISRTFRWNFQEWRFFAAMAVAAVVLLCITTLLSVWCYYGFGKGLKRFLYQELEDPIESGKFAQVTPDDVEKAVPIDFPTSGPVPTYAVAFGYTGMVHSNEKSGYHSDTLRSQSSFNSTSSSSEGVGSPLQDPDFPTHDPKFLDAPSEYTMSSLPPRFRSQPSSIVNSDASPIVFNNRALPGSSNNSHSGVSRGQSSASSKSSNSTHSADSGSDPFSFDAGRRHSNGSRSSGRSKGSGMTMGMGAPRNMYGQQPPQYTPRHVPNGSSASGGKRWVIE